MKLLRFLCCVMLSVAAWGQDRPAPQPTTPIVSPEVHSDSTVTFRFRDPNAKSVSLRIEGQSKSIAMEKDDQGVWTVTTSPLGPDYYGYSFVADGVTLMDPSNWLIKPNLLNPQSAVHVTGTATLPWEVNETPHGEVHHHFYRSAVAGDDRDYYVYTPPDYQSKTKETFPVLYLLHGFSDDASGWTGSRDSRWEARNPC